MLQNYYNTKGLDTSKNPMLLDGGLIHAVNVESFPNGAKMKRYGYAQCLSANATSNRVNDLWSFAKNNGTQFWNYQAAGSEIFYSEQGTGDWTRAGNGTIANNAHVGHAVLADTMIIGDASGSTRHTVNGTSFINTTLAPKSQYFTESQGRIHAQGTASTNFYSSANDPTNWQTSGTSDSSSFEVPGGGKLIQSFKTNNRLLLPKNNNEIYSWDGYSLVDLATNRGPASPYSLGDTEGYKLGMNRYGIYGYGGGQPELLSQPIQRQIYNSTLTGAVNNDIETVPGASWYYNYVVAVGTITDDFTKRTIPDAIIKFDFQKNEFLNWNLADFPTCLNSAIDFTGFEYLYFGDAYGNTFRFEQSLFSDAGEVIESEMVFLFNHQAPHFDKTWRWWRGVFSPSCQAVVQYATADILDYPRLVWKDMEFLSTNTRDTGVKEFRFPADTRSRFLFVRIYEASLSPSYIFYGQSIDAEVIEKR